MNTDKRRLKRIGLSVFIGVNRRLKMPFSDFFSSLLRRVQWGLMPVMPIDAKCMLTGTSCLEYATTTGYSYSARLDRSLLYNAGSGIFPVGRDIRCLRRGIVLRSRIFSLLVVATFTMISALSAFAQPPKGQMNPPAAPATDPLTNFGAAKGASTIIPSFAPPPTLSTTTWTAIGPASLSAGGGNV